MGFAEQQNPESVLDVGVGMGQYGFLLRTNLENINLFETNGSDARQRSKDQWKITIDGIEGYAGYLTVVHDYSYNNLMIGNALELLPTLGDKTYDLVLAIDILEHFEKEQGIAFLQECQRVSRGSVLKHAQRFRCTRSSRQSFGKSPLSLERKGFQALRF